MALSAISSLRALCESVPTTVVSLSARYPRGHSPSGISRGFSTSFNLSNDPSVSLAEVLVKRAFDGGLDEGSFNPSDFLEEHSDRTLLNTFAIRGRHVGRQAHSTATAGSATVHNHESFKITMFLSATTLNRAPYPWIVTHHCNQRSYRPCQRQTRLLTEGS